MKRERFLEAFFGALGEKSFVIRSACPDRIEGTVLYDEHEEQDFCWNITEEQVPSESAYLLLKLLQEQKLIEIDRIIVPREELQQRYVQSWGKVITAEEFERDFGRNRRHGGCNDRRRRKNGRLFHPRVTEQPTKRGRRTPLRSAAALSHVGQGKKRWERQ